MIDQIYLIFILIGTTIGVVMFALGRLARRTDRISLALIRLNEQLDFDPPTFLNEAWPLLAQAGLRGMAWRLDWFGAPIERQFGNLRGVRIERSLQAAEIKLDITLYPRKARGERRYFDEALIETFMLLLRTDMWIKAGTTEATFAEMARLNLFLQHDMKNIAQFIQLMSDQLAAAPVGKELQMLDYLRTAAPLIRNRADRIVRTLMSRQPEDRPLRNYSLRFELERLCRLHRLDGHISGDAEIQVRESVLDSALDNILKNYADIAQRSESTSPTIHIAIVGNDRQPEISIESPDALSLPNMERLFEPFWRSDPSGLGIGLYQARHLLASHQGNLGVEKTADGRLCFRILCPPQESASAQTF